MSRWLGLSEANPCEQARWKSRTGCGLHSGSQINPALGEWRHLGVFWKS
jgi:hypothetical protein